jgi:hypothetical protein
MKIAQFDTPGNNGDLAGNAELAKSWSDELSSNFDQGVQRVQSKLALHPGAVSQYYNPVTHGLAAPDLALPSGVITWNGFPRKFLGASAGVSPNFAGAEPAIIACQTRPQDEYLEWHVIRTNGKITRFSSHPKAMTIISSSARTLPTYYLACTRNSLTHPYNWPIS